MGQNDRDRRHHGQYRRILSRRERGAIVRTITTEDKVSNRTPSTYFANPYRGGTQQTTQSSFEQVVQSLRLTPEQYASSDELRAWVSRNKSFKYVPPDLLAIFGFKAGAEV
jgi:hypothetical protein